MEDSLRIIGEYGAFQTGIKIILLSCAFLTNIYSNEIDIMLKFPNFIILQNNSFNISNTTLYDYKYCDKNRYKIELDENTLLKNWNYNFKLFCENEYYLYYIYLSVLIGNIFGVFFLSSISDRIGRENVLKYSVIFSSFLHINFLFCLNKFHLLLINFFGSFNSFIFITSIICITEYLPHQSNGINIGIFNLVYRIYPIILYYSLLIFPNWKIFFFCTSLSHIFLIKYTFNIFLESPHWLFSIGQKIKCLSILDRIALYNGKLTSWNEYQNINIENANRFGRASNNFAKLFNFELDSGEIEQNFKGVSIFDIFSFKSQKYILILISILCFVYTIYSYGVLLIIKSRGNYYDFFIYENINELILIWIFDIIIGIISGYFCDILGRRPMIMFYGLFGSFGFFIYLENGSDIFLVISLICSQGINTILLIYIPEMISTPIRNTLCGWFYLEYKIISIILEMTYKHINKEFFNYLIVLAGFLTGFCVLYMKETLEENIPDIIPELKDKIETLENLNMRSFNSTEYPSFLIS